MIPSLSRFPFENVQEERGGEGGKEASSSSVSFRTSCLSFSQTENERRSYCCPYSSVYGDGKRKLPPPYFERGFFSFPPPLHAVRGWNERDTGRKCFNTYIHTAVFSGGNAKKCQLLLSGGMRVPQHAFLRRRGRGTVIAGFWIKSLDTSFTLYSAFTLAYLETACVCVSWEFVLERLCFTNRLAQSILTFPIGVVNNIVCRIPNYKKKHILSAS